MVVHMCADAHNRHSSAGSREWRRPNTANGLVVLGAVSLQHRLRRRSGELHQVSCTDVYKKNSTSNEHFYIGSQIITYVQIT